MINNSEFKIKEFPNFDPIIDKWERIEWWKTHKRRIFEGYWVGGKWIPPELYYYINFHKIVIEDGIYRNLDLPFLRDIDWEKFLIYTEAIGFSGFENDDETSCHRDLKKLINEEITKDELIRDVCPKYKTSIQDKTIYNSIFKKNNTPKKYKEARDYLQKTHKKNLGKPLYFNQAKHVIEMASRGYGKSYSGSGLISHNYMTDGLKDYDYWLHRKNDGTPMKSETGVGAIDSKYSDDLLNKVKIAFENYYDSHIVKQGNNVIKYPSPLFIPYTGSFMSGKAITAVDSKSQIHHRTLQDNPLAFNGTRPNRVFLDEAGFINNIQEASAAIEATQAAAQFKRLTMYLMGTGGLTSGGAAMHIYEMFYAPEEFGCLSFEDKWENKGKIGYFTPATRALNKYKEGSNLITNEERALDDIQKERDAAKKSPTRTKLMGTIINKPIVPSEMFLRMEGTFFPIQDLKIRLADLEATNSILAATYKYDYNIVNGKSIPSISDKPVIREFPLRKGFDMDACVEVFELPKKSPDGHVFPNRYIAGWDPIMNDGNEDTERSLQSLFILDSWTDRIVAEYTARTYLVEEYYETARRLLLYFNARCNYENQIKGPYAYFKNKNSLHLLVETPEILKDQNLLKGGTIGNTSLGTNTNDSIINWSLGLILSWLESQAYDKDEGIRNIDILRSPALIKELISFSRDINTDRISALGMVMILREDRARITELAKQSSVKSKSKDPFWDRAYNSSSVRYGFKNGNLIL